MGWTDWKYRRIVPAAMAAAVLTTVGCSGRDVSEAKVESGTVRILWLGSSSTYFHDMPNQFAKWVNANTDMKAESDLVGRSGTAVYKYLQKDFPVQYGLERGQTVLDKIREGDYDFVVLQVPTDYLAGRGDNSREDFVAGIRTYCKAIRQAGGKPVFYEQGWGNDALFDEGDRLLLELAQELEVIVAPCRTAWRQIREERPDLELHNLPDRVHLGTLGNYVNLCCFYAAITGKSPVGLPQRVSRSWRRLSDEEKAEAREKLAGMTIDDPYVRRLPSWMQRNSISAKVTVLDDELAKYFQQAAWRSWLKYEDRRTQETST